MNIKLSKILLFSCMMSSGLFNVLFAQCVTPVITLGYANKKISCISDTVKLSGVTIQNDVSKIWSTTGSGSFNNPTFINPTYTPSASDLQSNGVNLIITVSGNCIVVKDTLKLFFVPKVQLTVTSPVCGGGSTTGSISSVASSGNAPYTYSWSNSLNTQNISNVNTGTYTLTVTDASNCTITSTGVIKSNLVASVSTSAIPNKKITCVSGVVNVTGVTAQNNNTILWTSSGTGIFSSNTSLNPGYTPSTSDLQSGGVKLIITASGNCNNPKDSIMIYFVTRVQVTSVSPSCSSSGYIPGSVTSTPSSGNMPYTYVWSSGQTTQNLSNVSPGSYTVTVKDASGCTVTSNGSVNAPLPAAVSTAAIPNKKITCVSGPVSMTGVTSQSSITTLWTTSGTGTFSNVASLNTLYTPTTADFTKGSITLYIDVNGNCGSARDSVILSLGPKVFALGSDPECGESNYGLGTINAAGSGGKSPYTYLWSNGQTAASVPLMSPGSYTVTVTDANGCSITSVATINPLVINSVIAQSNDTLIVTPTGSGWTYQWSIDGNLITNSNFPYRKIQGNGAYSVKITAANGCEVTKIYTVTTTSILDVSQKLNIVIVPNPSNGVFSVLLTGIYDEANIELLNIVGQRVYCIENIITTRKIEVNISQLPQGSYFLKIWNENGSTTRLIIKE